MPVSVQTLLGELPPFKDERILIKEDQRVSDIIKQVLISHEKYKGYYDKIAPYFLADTIEGICKKIYSFLKHNVEYVEESDQYQTTALPTAILSLGKGDCKHYASFAGGILSAVERLTGQKINWCYRFASYDVLTKTPGHVFVVVWDSVNELWIDPVPGADKMNPVWLLDKHLKNNSMALYEIISGIPEDQNFSVADDSLNPQLVNSIQLLLDAGIVDENGNVNTDQYQSVIASVSNAEAERIVNAFNYVSDGKGISGLFSNIAHVMAKIAMAPARGAFLALVALNFRSWAKNMNEVFSDPTVGPDAIEKVRAKWYPMGGDWAQLMNAVNDGKGKKQLGAIGIAVESMAVLAAAISAAIVPIITAVMKNLPSNNQLPIYTGPLNPVTTTTTGSGLMNWIKQNPVMLVGIIGVGGYFYLQSKEKKVGKAKDFIPVAIIGGTALVFYLMKVAADKKAAEAAADPSADPKPLPAPKPIAAGEPVLDPNSGPVYSPPNKDLTLYGDSTVENNEEFPVLSFDAFNDDQYKVKAPINNDSQKLNFV